MATFEVEVAGSVEPELSAALSGAGWQVHERTGNRIVLTGQTGTEGVAIFRILELISESGLELVGLRRLDP